MAKKKRSKKEVKQPKKKAEPVIETEGEGQEPTGHKKVKIKGMTFWRYTYGPGGRMVNTNKVCNDCKDRKNCYTGKHALVVACSDKR